jgi:hypothetical protein
METALVKLETPELQAIEQSKAEQIKATFEPMAQMLSEFETQFNEVVTESEKGITKEVTAKAKRVRIDIGKVRIATEKIRVAQKEEYLRAGKAIDGVSNILKWAVTDKENKLKEIEDYFEIQEQKRIEALQLQRAEMLLPYVTDAFERKLAEMEEDVWNAYLAAKKKEHEDRLEAERKAEEERIAREKAEAAERQRIREENERLRKEAEEREKQAKIEAEKRAKEDEARRKKEEAERKAREEKERKEREEYEAKLKAEREERERIQREEEAKRRKLEEELRAKDEAERKAKEDEQARIQAEYSKGDAEKVKDLIADLKALKTKYSFKSQKNIRLYSDVSLLLDKVINHIEK